jgi:hypothetical protein
VVVVEVVVVDVVVDVVVVVVGVSYPQNVMWLMSGLDCSTVPLVPTTA